MGTHKKAYYMDRVNLTQTRSEFTAVGSATDGSAANGAAGGIVVEVR